jgi:hypothetical protein
MPQGGQSRACRHGLAGFVTSGGDPTAWPRTVPMRGEADPDPPARGSGFLRPHDTLLFA